MAWGQLHGIFYGLAGMEWYMIWPDGHGMVYNMTLQAWLGAWFGLWYSLVDKKMVYGNAWRALHLV